MRRRRLRAAALLAGAAGLAACTGDSEPDAADPAVLLDAAQATLDQTSSVHFALSSAELPEGATALVGGEGDAARPDSFEGELDITLGGIAATVAVVSVDGTLYAQLPFSDGFTETDPASIGIADPGTLLGEDGGVISLLSAATGPVAGEDARIGDTVVRTVEATLPADAVAEALASAEGAGDFDAVFSIDPETTQLLRTVITGEFLVAGNPSTYTVDLSDYDVPVDIDVPADISAPAG